jgi:NAD(P)-dependent dehydrogenase (short-subunit alcohol dehydrogenase family)
MSKMQGKLILVTGGNRGLGLEVCRKVVNAGGKVILTARNHAAGINRTCQSWALPHFNDVPCAGEAAAQGLCREHPGSATALELDAADPASVDALVTKIKADYDQKIDFLVCTLIEHTRTYARTQSRCDGLRLTLD